MPWCASAPHHITSIFYPVYTSKTESTGSLGVGLAVEPRVKACTPGTDPPPTTTAERALKLLGISVRSDYSYKIPLPPGKGYAVSASTAITTAVVAAYSTGRSRLMKALRAAHASEIIERTGLGDVLSISCGIGIVLRYQAGAPGYGLVDCVQLPGTINVFSLEAKSGQHTSSLLASLDNERVLIDAKRRLTRLADKLSPEEYIRESQSFTLQHKTYADFIEEKDLEQILSTPGLIGFYAKKRVAVIFVESDRVHDARDHLLSMDRFILRYLEPSVKGLEVWYA